MNFTAWLDVAIGLGIVYLGASLFVTIISEYVSQVLNLRGRAVFSSLTDLITDTDLRAKLARSPALKPFFGEGSVGKNCPSYIDPIIMARALIGNGQPGAPAALPEKLQAVVGAVGKETGQMVMAVSHWIDSSLTMLGENYKRWVRWITFGIGVLVSIGLNLDTLALTSHLYRDKEARDGAVAVALDVTAKTDKATFEHCLALTPRERSMDFSCAQVSGLVEAVRGRNASLGKLPIGWGAVTPVGAEAEPVFWLARALGWLLTALALSLGAPFWFDLLGKLVNVRHGMKRPEISSESIPEGGKAEVRGRNQQQDSTAQG